MKLEDYLKKHQLTHEKFALKVGVSRPFITMILRGYNNPSVKLIKRIQEATKGEVRFEDLYNPEAPSRIKNNDNKHIVSGKT